jgi:hypothetical protein
LIQALNKNLNVPKRTDKGECPEGPDHEWSTGGQMFGRELMPESTPDHKRTATRKKVLDLAATQADVPVEPAST